MDTTKEDLFDVKTRDAALRWRGMDELVRDIRAFKTDTDRLPTEADKKTLLSFAERVDYLMPPSLNRLRKYAYDEAISVLADPGVFEKNVVSMAERWSSIISRMCDGIAPQPPHFDVKLLNGNHSSPAVRRMKEASGAVVHFVHSCEPHLASIKNQFPSFYAALIPLRYSVKLMEVRGATRKHNDGTLDDGKYADIVDAFLSDDRNSGLLTDDDLRNRISQSKNDSIQRKLLEQPILRAAMKIQLPALGNRYTSYVKLLTDALNRDIVKKYPLPRDPDKPDEEARGDSPKMVLDNPDAQWLEMAYEFRWARVAREVTKQLDAHKTEFRGGGGQDAPLSHVAALEVKSVRNSPQGRLFD